MYTARYWYVLLSQTNYIIFISQHALSLKLLSCLFTTIGIVTKLQYLYSKISLLPSIYRHPSSGRPRLRALAPLPRVVYLSIHIQYTNIYIGERERETQTCSIAI